MSYMDHFSENSDSYLQFRPQYPDELFQYLASLVSQHSLAWDCGTGNGQAATKIATYFKKVVASDISQAQLDVAVQRPNIHYHCWSAEHTQLANNSVDLIIIAQALHWFKLSEFYDEVKRVLKPDGVIAAFCYSLAQITPAVDKVVTQLYENILGDAYWPKERRYIDQKYETIPFPFERMTTPKFNIEKEADYSQMIGYLNTWSAVKEYHKRNGQNPLNIIEPELRLAWGKEGQTHKIIWPLHLLVGRKE